MPAIDVDVDEKYVVELVEMDEAEAKFDNSKPGDTSLIWKFRLWQQSTGEPVFDQRDDTQYELWQFTPPTTYRNAKSGKVARAREWTEALVGRELSDEEMSSLIDGGFEDAVLHKRAVADLEWYTTQSGATRLKIIRLRPYKKAAKAKPATLDDEDDTPAPAPARQATVRKALGLDDEDQAA